jgi:hypothetical protein
VETTFRCYKCSAVLSATDDKLGTIARCPHCGSALQIPGATPVASPAPEPVSVSTGTDPFSFVQPEPLRSDGAQRKKRNLMALVAADVRGIIVRILLILIVGLTCALLMSKGDQIAGILETAREWTAARFQAKDEAGLKPERVWGFQAKDAEGPKPKIWGNLRRIREQAAKPGQEPQPDGAETIAVILFIGLIVVAYLLPTIIASLRNYPRTGSSPLIQKEL